MQGSRISSLDNGAHFLYDRAISRLINRWSRCKPMEALISQLNAMQRTVQQLMERL